MRKILISMILAILALPAVAQLKLPRLSQHAVLTQTVGLTDVTIDYSRPGVKGRTIFGTLVPYGQVWRTGANEATTIAFSDDVMIDGKPLARGTYSLHTIPGADEWTLIFNSVADQWGSFNYDQAKDALRVKVRAHKAAPTEWMTFDVPSVSTDSATVEMRWADVAVPFTISANTTAKVMANAREAIAAAKPGDWRTPLSAAGFAFDHGMDADASKWLDASLAVGENMNNLWLKARILAKAGKKAEAIRTGELALSKKTDKGSAELASEVRTQIDAWKK